MKGQNFNEYEAELLGKHNGRDKKKSKKMKVTGKNVLKLVKIISKKGKNEKY